LWVKLKPNSVSGQAQAKQQLERNKVFPDLASTFCCLLLCCFLTFCHAHAASNVKSPTAYGPNKWGHAEATAHNKDYSCDKQQANLVQRTSDT